METNIIYQNTVRNITKIILTNQQKIIREEDLRNLCASSLDFSQIINDVYTNLNNVGFELISTKFLEHKLQFFEHLSSFLYL